MVKTSKLVLRPFIPTGMVASGNAEEDAKRIDFLKEKKMDRREQYATLTYGNVTIELDYTIFMRLSLDVGKYYDRERAIFNLGKDEILTEMALNRGGSDELDPNSWHRDNPEKCSITHPTSPLANESGNWTCLVDGRRNMEWDRNHTQTCADTTAEAIVYAAYAVDYLYGGKWSDRTVVIGQKYEQILNDAEASVKNGTYDAVRVYGVFNGDATFLKVIGKADK